MIDMAQKPNAAQTIQEIEALTPEAAKMLYELMLADCPPGSEIAVTKEVKDILVRKSQEYVVSQA